jgi:hypothetical protein
MSERNAPCACGSGRKLKACCGADKRKKTNWRAATIVALFVAAAGWAVTMAVLDAGAERELPEGWVWSEEHGHPHRVGGEAEFVEPPPGSVWVPEHGHFHDADGNAVGGGATPTPHDLSQP